MVYGRNLGGYIIRYMPRNHFPKGAYMAYKEGISTFLSILRTQM